ncbi:uncharacterized protein LOC121375172 [Gigantopelta aegis]|uniref:uncharacterized protein LOC121375172 n=1 Tax=Gigantopelta aegis TaxID=1735272 RepID=UPI001B88E39E|nr:uncharacterized protein LOC121375172 [Gigantopelta aegis]
MYYNYKGQKSEIQPSLMVSWSENEVDGVTYHYRRGVAKREELDHSRMAVIDKHALSIPDHLFRKPLRDVVRYLIQPANDEIEIARALFRWITAQNFDLPIYDDPDVKKLPNDYACVLLHKVKTGSLEYADVYRDMANLANIECVRIAGVRKVFPKEPCPTVCKLTTWVWVSVLLEGRWRLVDCHMGAIYWKESKESGSADLKPGKDGRRSLASFLNDFYFLTNAKDLIVSHFPNVEHWQLLSKPVKNAEFMTMSYLTPHYSFYSIRAIHQDRLVVQTTNGETSFEFAFSKNIPMQFSYRLRKIDGNDCAEAPQNLKEFVFLETNRRNHLVKYSITPPEHGQYVFDLFGKDSSNQKNKKMYHLRSYLVQCFYVEQPFCGFPHNELVEWGPGIAADAAGMIPVSHFEGIANTIDGKVEIVFSLSKRLIFDQKLTKKDLITSKCYDAYALNRIENGQVIFSVNPPKQGDYCLKILATEKNGNSQFRNVCTYLIRCSDILEEPTPYPKEACGRVGVKNACGRLGLTLISPQSPVIYSPENGKISLRFLLFKPVLLSPKLYYCDEKGNTEQLTACLNQHRRASDVIIHLKFPRHGLYHFRLSSRNPNNDEGFVEVYNAIIHCNWPSREFPTEPPCYLDGWKSNYILHSPKKKYLAAKCSVFVSLTVPGAHSVIANSIWRKYKLQRKRDSLWEGYIETEECSSKSVCKVAACMDKRLSSYSSLVEFTILSQSEMQRLQDNSYQMAIQRINRLENEGKWRHPPINPDVVCDVDDDDIPPQFVTGDKTTATLDTGEAADAAFPIIADCEFSKSFHIISADKLESGDHGTETTILPVEKHMNTSSNAVGPRTKKKAPNKRTGLKKTTQKESLTKNRSKTHSYDKGKKENKKSSLYNDFSAIQIRLTKILSAKLSASKSQPAKTRPAKSTPAKRISAKIPVVDVGRFLYSFGDPSGHHAEKKEDLDKKPPGRKEHPRTPAVHGGVSSRDVMKQLDLEKTTTSQVSEGAGGDKYGSWTSPSDSDSEKDLMQISEYARWKTEQNNKTCQNYEKTEHDYRKSRLAVLKTRLLSNIQSRDKLGLKEAVTEAQKENIAVDTVEFAQATRTMSMLSLRDEMRDYIDQKDLEGLRSAISAIQRRGFVKDLSHDLVHAKASLKLLARTSQKRFKLGVIDIPTLAEIFRYREPSMVVHRVFMAALLLLGIPEGITKKWKRCQQICVTIGSVGLNRRVHHLVIDEVHPMIAARARQIMETYIPEQALGVSPGVAALYKWTRQVIDEVLLDTEDPENPVPPANERTQRQILRAL